MPVVEGSQVVLEAACVVLLRDPRATMADIAAEAGISVAGPYRRYSGRRSCCGSSVPTGCGTTSRTPRRA